MGFRKFWGCFEFREIFEFFSRYSPWFATKYPCYTLWFLDSPEVGYFVQPWYKLRNKNDIWMVQIFWISNKICLKFSLKFDLNSTLNSDTKRLFYYFLHWIDLLKKYNNTEHICYKHFWMHNSFESRKSKKLAYTIND